jgi:isopentenyl phosphate kinase
MTKASLALGPPMAKPALVKVGGSLLTDKAREGSFRRAPARRILAEIAKAGLPTVLLHGAGSFGHPQAARAGLEGKGESASSPGAVAEVFASLAQLEAQVLDAATRAGLDAMPVPLHLAVHDEGESLAGLPVETISSLLEEGYTPVLHGTLVRAEAGTWRILSADRILAELAGELRPRLALFVTDVDGVFEGEPGASRLLEKAGPESLAATATSRRAGGTDVTGAMGGKLAHAIAAARHAPTLILNGGVRGRVLEALRGRPVVGTRIQP